MFSFENHKEQLLLLEKVLGREGFRFVLIGQNHTDVFLKIRSWLHEKFPQQAISTIEVYGKDYRSFMDELKSLDKAWILIPDFERLFEKGYEAFCTAINQRRDYLARNNKVLICFLFQDKLKLIPDKIPDLWSLRTLELSFEVKIKVFGERNLDSRISIIDKSTFGNKTLKEKLAEINNLKRQLKNTGSENLTLLENIHRQLAEFYLELSDWESSTIHINKLIELTSVTRNKQNRAIALSLLGTANYVRGEHVRAMADFFDALKISQEIGDKSIEGTILGNMSLLHEEKGYFLLALDYLEKSLQIMQEIGNKESEAGILNNLGELYRKLGNNSQAIEMFENALKIQREIGDKYGEGGTLNNLGLVYDHLGDTSKAYECFNQALTISREYGSLRNESATLNNLGHFFRDRGDNKKSNDYLMQSLAISRKIGNKVGMIPTLFTLALIAHDNGNIQKHNSYLTEAWQLANATESLSGLFTVGTYIGSNMFVGGQKQKGLELLKIAYKAGAKARLSKIDEVEKLIKKYENELLSEKK